MPNTIHHSYSSQYLPSELKQSENNIFSNLTNGLIRLTQFILNNPGKTITLSLASQVLGSSALGKSQNQSSDGNNNLTQEFIGKLYLADSLAAIEQRMAPVLNLTWLNQTDATKMEFIPASLSTNNTHVDERSHRVKRDNRQRKAVNFLESHAVCLISREYNEYLYASNDYETGGWKDGNRWKAFTWTDGDKPKEARWRFIRTGDGTTFYIYNTHHGRYLYDTNVQWDEHTRYQVKTSPYKEGGTHKWEVQALTARGLYAHEPPFIALWNDQTERALYASGDTQSDGYRRYAFTWPRLTEGDKSVWRIQNCDSFRRRREISDKLEDTTSPPEKENLGYLDKIIASRVSFFQIKQPDQNNRTFEAASISDFDSRAENQVTSSQLNRTTIS